MARSSRAKIRNVLSILFDHACRYELFDRNPMRFARQGAKRRSAPVVLAALEIRALVDHLALRERTLVLLAASTGLRQSELLDLCEPLAQRTEAVLGRIDPSQIRSTSCRVLQYSKAHRLAHFPTHLLDVAPECRSGVQSDAGADETFHVEDDDGRLHASSCARQARRASSRAGFVLPNASRERQ